MQVLEQLQHLRLDGDVERRRRLVGDQKVRVVGERHGDHHPLLLSAGKFVRQGAQAILGFGQADQVEHFQNPVMGIGGAERLVQVQDLGNLFLD